VQVNLIENLVPTVEILCPLDDNIHACTQHLLLFREIVRVVDNEWANLVDIASVQGLNLLTVHPGSMEAGLLYEHFLNTLLCQNPLSKLGVMMQNPMGLNYRENCKALPKHISHSNARRRNLKKLRFSSY
jgi:hypothetical protein